MKEQDFYKPTNIRDSIFGQIDLPEKSRIQKGPPALNKYQAQFESEEQDKNDLNDLGFSNLGEVSKIQPSIKQTNNKYEPPLQMIKQVSDIKKQSGGSLTRPNSSSRESTSSKGQEQNTIDVSKKGIQQVRKAPNTKIKKQSSTNNSKKVVDLDAEIGQVGEWLHKDQNDKQQDFDKDPQNQVKVNREIQQQLRKRAEQKAKQLENKNYKPQTKPMGLTAKAQQLRKKNEELRNSHIPEHLNAQLTKQKSTQKNLPSSQKIEQDVQTSTDHLIVKNPEKNINSPQKIVSSKLSSSKQPQINSHKIYQHEQNDDDPWLKVNQKTAKQYKQKIQRQQNAVPMSKQHIIDYYSRQFLFAEQDIQAQFQINSNEEQEATGFWQSLCGCFKSNKQAKQKPDKKTSKNRLAMRLLAISKINITNTDQEFYILKQIWENQQGKNLHVLEITGIKLGFRGGILQQIQDPQVSFPFFNGTHMFRIMIRRSSSYFNGQHKMIFHLPQPIQKPQASSQKCQNQLKLNQIIGTIIRNITTAQFPIVSRKLKQIITLVIMWEMWWIRIYKQLENHFQLQQKNIESSVNHREMNDIHHILISCLFLQQILLISLLDNQQVILQYEQELQYK